MVRVGRTTLPGANGIFTATEIANGATTGTPAGIDLSAAVKGPVDSIQTNGSFVVLGQTISTNTLTQ